MRLHGPTRASTEKELLRSPGRFRALHGTAELYYRGRLNFDEPVDESSPYSSYARYEDPAWQQSTREWLYHAGKLSVGGFAAAKIAMIRLFFEAFWWWDTEVPSAYCHLLIADLKTLPDTLRGDWVDLLEKFRSNYVAGTANQHPGEDRERWLRAHDALTALWFELDLRKQQPPEDPDLRSIYVITCSLYADVVWYGSTGADAAREAAAAWFQLSAANCTDESNHWIGSWAIYLEADLWAEVDPDRALELVADLPERIDEDEDNENRANLVLLHADIRWIQGNRTLAFDLYTRAVFHYLVYHVWQEIRDQAPSTYTVSIYETATSKFRDRLAEARQDGDEELARIAEARMTEFFAPYWEQVGTQSADGTGVPPQPGPDDLGRTASQSRYSMDILRLREAMEEVLEQDVDAPLTGLWTVWPEGGSGIPAQTSDPVHDQVEQPERSEPGGQAAQS
jgi:hypothetical protein